MQQEDEIAHRILLPIPCMHHKDFSFSGIYNHISFSYELMAIGRWDLSFEVVGSVEQLPLAVGGHSGEA
jgi:hypothetical protein